MQRTWLNADSGNPHYSFVEYVCCYFNELFLSEQSDGGLKARASEGLLTEQEFDVTLTFHNLFDQYNRQVCDPYDHPAILADDRWRMVVVEAARAKAALGALLTDPDEIGMLRNASPSALQASRIEGIA